MKKLVPLYWLVTAAWFAGAVAWVMSSRTPILIDQVGTSLVPQLWQKIFYLHMPIAVCALLSCMVVLVGSVGFLAQRKSRWDDLAHAGACVAVALCTVVLLTGMIWGRGAWGHWWDWHSPKLVFSLMLWLLFVVYLVIRGSIEGEQRRAVVSAVYGLVAALDVPLVWLSSRMIPDDTHPIVPLQDISSERRIALAIGFVAAILVSAGLIAAQYSLNRKNRARANALREAANAATDAAPLASGGAA